MPHRSVSQILTVAAVLTLLAIAGPATAQSGKIGVLDTQKVVLESATGKAALAPLEAWRQGKEEEGKAKNKELGALRQRLADQGPSLGETELAALRNQVETKTQEIRRFQEDTSAEFRRRQSEVLQEIDRKVMPVVNSYALDQGYSMIFRKFESGLVYVDNTIDVTDAIIQRLDAQ